MEWRKIVGSSNYEVSDEGQVRNCKTNKLLTGSLYKGYRRYVLKDDNGKRFTIAGQRLVLEAFRPQENMAQLQVNHIDRNRDNNRLDNLEWTTAAENNNWKQQKDNPNLQMNNRKVIVDYLDGHREIYTGTQQCSELLHISREEVLRYIHEPLTEARRIPAYFYYEDTGIQEARIRVEYLDGRIIYYNTRMECAKALGITTKTLGLYTSYPCGVSRKIRANFSFEERV